MKTLPSTALGIALFLTVSSVALAQQPGDVGSFECRALQQSVQAQVGDESKAGKKNHGQFVKTVAHLVGPRVESGEITEECASCIISQFARRIAIAMQKPCGPAVRSCQPQTCGTFTVCDPDVDCFCFEVVEGGGVCVNDYFCFSAVRCPNGTSDCPSGSVCTTNTCCGEPLCAALICDGTILARSLFEARSSASASGH